MEEKILIDEYNPAWAEVFQCMSVIFQNELGDLILSIEHIGSTSIKGLSAKPIIDIDVVIENEHLFPQVIKRLEKLGYFHKGDLGIKNRESFGRIDQFVPIDDKGSIWMEHHLYVCPQDSPELKRHLTFRDYLRANLDAVMAYERLKRELARSSKDRHSYTLAKGDFIESILKKAQGYHSIHYIIIIGNETFSSVQRGGEVGNHFLHHNDFAPYPFCKEEFRLLKEQSRQILT